MCYNINILTNFPLALRPKGVKLWTIFRNKPAAKGDFKQIKLDLLDLKSLEKILKKIKPQLVIHTARIEPFDTNPIKVEKFTQEKIRHIVSLEEKIAFIRVLLQSTVERAFSDLVRGAQGKVDVIVNFLALLELSKQKFLHLDQKRPFEDIIIKRI